MHNQEIFIDKNLSLIKATKSDPYIDYRNIKINDKFIGHISIEKLNLHDHFTIDISLNKDQQHKGYGTKILKNYLKYIFNHTSIKNILDMIVDKESENKTLKVISDMQNKIFQINNNKNLSDEEKENLRNKINNEVKKIFQFNLNKNPSSRRLHEKLGFKLNNLESCNFYTITKEEFLSYNFSYLGENKDNKKIIDLLLEDRPVIIELKKISDHRIQEEIKSILPFKYIENSEILERVKSNHHNI
jgi:hypothetical protein